MITFADDRYIQANPEMQMLVTLILAVNHYISTGDLIGHGAIYTKGSLRYIGIPVNRRLPDDVRDFAKLQARMEELEGRGGWRLTFRGDTPRFDMWELEVELSDVARLITELTAVPGPLGWGTPKVIIDRLRGRGAAV